MGQSVLPSQHHGSPRATLLFGLLYITRITSTSILQQCHRISFIGIPNSQLVLASPMKTQYRQHWDFGAQINPNPGRKSVGSIVPNDIGSIDSPSAVHAQHQNTATTAIARLIGLVAKCPDSCCGLSAHHVAFRILSLGFCRKVRLPGLIKHALDSPVGFCSSGMLPRTG
jgi:hypothetical protein